MSVTLMQLAKIPMLKVTGDVGGYFEVSDELQPGLEYFVGVSDGTLLKGVTGQGFSVQIAGTATVSITNGGTTAPVFDVKTGGTTEVGIANGVATIDGPVTWVMLSSPTKCADVKTDAEESNDEAPFVRKSRPAKIDELTT